jgi:uncharacterized membrane protein YraQ (UPF0718 family)
MGRFLLVGATLAAVVHAFLPQSIAATVAVIPVLAILVMMVLAFVLSLCSESDAFIAESFVRFGPASQLAFLVFGPMVDFKLAPRCTRAPSGAVPSAPSWSPWPPRRSPRPSRRR